jgi:hypothetical protein
VFHHSIALELRHRTYLVVWRIIDLGRLMSHCVRTRTSCPIIHTHFIIHVTQSIDACELQVHFRFIVTKGLTYECNATGLGGFSFRTYQFEDDITFVLLRKKTSPSDPNA